MGIYGPFGASMFVLVGLPHRQALPGPQLATVAIDGRLKAVRSRLTVRGRSYRKRPGSLLKDTIPNRTMTDWNDAKPLFLEIDLVRHEDGDSRRSFASR